MLTPISENDFDKIKELVTESVRISIAKSDKEAEILIEDTIRSLKSWRKSKSAGFHCKYSFDGEVVGFIVVKDYWNLSHLFVSPGFQGRSIGRSLVNAAITECKNKSPRRKIQLNSSSNAAKFYKAVGFKQTGSGVDLPGGCIPFEYGF